MNNFGLKFNEIECEQGTPGWFEARTGVITASNIKTIRARLKNGEWSMAAKKYAFRLAFERTAKSLLDDTYSNAYMKRGNALKEDARVLHEMECGDLIIVPGFYASECGRFGASPDGLIGLDGGAEYKCFLSPDELMPILVDGDVSTVMDQMQMNMLATGRQWWDFMLYTPQMAGVCAKPYKIYRISRDEAYIAAMMADLTEFDGLITYYADLITGQYSISAAKEILDAPAEEEQANFDFEV